MLHVCVSATLYRPLEQLQQQQQSESLLSTSQQQQQLQQQQKQNHKELKDDQKQQQQLSSSTHTLSGANNVCPLTNSTYLDSFDETLDKKFIEYLFLEESKNRINDYYNTNKFGES